SPDSGDVLVQPRVLAKTVQIERAVVRFETGAASGSGVSQIEPTTPAASKPTTLSAETFYDDIAANLPALPAQLKAFVASLEPLGVYGEVRRQLLLKWRSPTGRDASLGTIDAQGRLFT